MDATGGISSKRIFRFDPRVVSRAPLTLERALELNASSSDKALLKQLQIDVKNLRNTLSGLSRILRVSPVPQSSAAIAQVTGGSIALNVVATASKLESTQEVNATPTSYGPFEPAWTGSGQSDAHVELDGTYSGSIGGIQDDELKVKVLTGGEVGVDTVRLGVYNSLGQQVATRTVRSYQAGTLLTLVAGVKIRLDAGELKKNDTFQFDVFGTVGSVVDPDKAFNGTGNLRPNFEYGKSVVAGSFKVNGQRIDVAAGDSIRSVLQKIDASAAGVTAAFDAARERIVLEQKTPGSGGAISLTNDTTGFLAATKLKNATVQKGSDDERDVEMSKVGALNAVRSGTLTVNGVEISINRYQDTLNEVIERLNGAGAGVTASFDAGELRFRVVSNTPETAFEIDDGATRFFETLSILEGTYEPTASGPDALAVRRIQVDEAKRIQAGLQDLERGMGAFFQRLGDLEATQKNVAERYRKNVSDAITKQLGSPEDRTTFRTRLGFDIDVSASSDMPLEVRGAGRRGVVESYLRRRDDLSSFLLGQKGDPTRKGFLADLDAAIRSVQENLERVNGTTGLLVDTLV